MPPRSSATLWFFLGLISFASGCTSLTPSKSLSGFWDDETAEAKVDLSHGPHCWVEIRPLSGESERVQLAVVPDMRMAQVIEQSNVSYRHMDAYILRGSPDNPSQQVKLEIRFDRDSGKVKWDTDYAIHPNDRVIIKEEAFTVLDEAYNSLLGPVLGRIGKD